MVVSLDLLLIYCQVSKPKVLPISAVCIRATPKSTSGSKLPILGMVIPPLIWNPYHGYIHPYYLVDDHPLLYGSNGSLHPSTYESKCLNRLPARVRVKLTAHSHHSRHPQTPRCHMNKNHHMVIKNLAFFFGVSNSLSIIEVDM